MPDIQITVRDKIASKVDDTVYVCSNSDYVIKFDFDDEWDAYDTKTARFAYRAGYVDVLFDGDTCALPVIHNADRVYVGVYAGELHTTTPAVIPCRKSILSDGGAPADPPDDVYAQLLAALNGKISEPAEDGTDGQVLTTDGKGGRSWQTQQGGSGTTDHSELTNRDAADQHPISAITGLQTALDGKMLCYESSWDTPVVLTTLARAAGFRPIAVSGNNWTLDGDTSGSNYDVYKGSINSGVVSFSMISQGHSVYTFNLLTGDGKYYTGYIQSSNTMSVVDEGAKYQNIRKVSADEDITNLPEGAYYFEGRSFAYSSAPDTTVSCTIYGLVTVDTDGYMDALYNGLRCHYDADTQSWYGSLLTDVAEHTENKVTELSSSSTNIQYPSAKAVWDALQSAGDTSLGITGATVGQIAKITAVDGTGKPTSWEPVDIPSAGSDAEWEVVADIITESEDVTYYRYNVTDKTKCYVMVSLTPLADATSTINGNIGINGVGSPWSNSQGITIMNNIQSVKTASKGMTYIASGKIVNGKWLPCILLASGNADGSWNTVQPKGMMALKNDSVTNVSSLCDVDKITSIAVGSYTKFFGVGSHIYILAR